ncbi:MAG: hypothetical protein AB7T06_01845 [Kofleriaceae bacterium]
MRVLLLVLIVGCDAGEQPSGLVVSTTFPVNVMFGTNSSYLEKYIGHELGLEITFPSFSTVKYMSTQDCVNTDAHLVDAPRIASGTLAADAQRELMDPLDQDWTVSFELCDDPMRSSISIDSAIDPYNFAIGCGSVPATAQQFGEDRFPLIASATVMRCDATILDVVNAYTIGNADFAMTVEARY